MSEHNYGGDDYGSGVYGGANTGEHDTPPYITAFDYRDDSIPARTTYTVDWAVEATAEDPLDTVTVSLHNEDGAIVEAVAVAVAGTTANAEHTIDTFGGVDTLRLTVSTRSNVTTTTVVEI